MKRASNAPRIFSPSGPRQTNDASVALRKKNKPNAPPTDELADLERDMLTSIEQAPLAGLQDASFATDGDVTGADSCGDTNAHDIDPLANDPDIIAAIKERDEALAQKALDVHNSKLRMLASLRAETASAKRSCVSSAQSARADTGILNLRPN